MVTKVNHFIFYYTTDTESSSMAEQLKAWNTWK